MLNNSEILNKYPTLPHLQAAPEWKSLSIRDRIALIGEYKTRKEIGNETENNNQSTIDVKINRNEQEQSKETKTHVQSSTQETNSTFGRETEIKDERKNETFSLDISLNESQQAAVNLAGQGKSFVLTGAAGSGKTTTERAIFQALLNAGFRPRDIAAGAFTRVATGNTRKAISKDLELAITLKDRIKTLHKHLEFAPMWYQDPETGKNKMRFVEGRNESNPFGFKILIIDEAPMCDLLLYQKIYTAMKDGTIVIFVGDINQLPPIFGKSIFNYALHQLPVIELNKIYRQADDSGVLQNAWRILDGQIPVKNKDTEIIWWDETKTKKMGQGRAAMALGKAGGFFDKKHEKGEYNPYTDIILIPWNEQEIGTKAINNWIAQFLGDKRKAIVHEIIAGRNKVYLAVGDLILVDKQLCEITAIEHNPGYIGKTPKIASQNLLRSGHYRATLKEDEDHDAELDENSMTGYADINIDEVADDERKNQASAVVSYKYADLDADAKDPDEGIVEYQLSTAGDFGEAGFSLGYATTCHKAQGSEWRKVFIIMHSDHSTKGNFVSREWLYTAVTRAREKLVILAKEEILERAVNNQIIRGKTLEEKIQHINAKSAGDIDTYPVIKTGEWASVNEEEEVEEPKEKERFTAYIPPTPKNITKFSDLSVYVSADVKARCISMLIRKWDEAKKIWGDSIGNCPTISFDCQKGNTLGLANPAKHHIKLNPVYLSSIMPEWVLNEQINKTIPHEVCHLVTARYVNMTGHGKDWEMAMRLMQEQPSQYYNGPTLPDWKESARKLLNNPNAIINDENLNEGEEE